MFYQQNKNLLNPIQEYGCFFLSCVNLAECINKKKLSYKEVNDLWDFHKKLEDINYNDDIVNSANIIKNCLFITDEEYNYKVYEIAIKMKGDIKYYKIPSEWKNKEDEYYYIQKVVTAKGNTHFRVVNKNDDVIIDSYYPIPKIKRVLYTIVYFVKKTNKGVTNGKI